VWLKLEVGNRRQDTSSRGESFLSEVVSDLRLYLRALMVDFVLSVCLWICLFAFQRLTEAFPIRVFEGVTVIAVHSVSLALH
jgi:hypothetical protein